MLQFCMLFQHASYMQKHERSHVTCAFFAFGFCWFAGCLPCPWPSSRPKLARSWSLLRDEADSYSDWPSAARFCPSSSHTCSTHQESSRSGNIFIIMTSECKTPEEASLMLFFTPFLCLSVVQSSYIHPQKWGVSGWGVLEEFYLFSHIFCRKWLSESKWSCCLSEPFMSLLLVLSHTEFKLVMEVRLTFVWNVTLKITLSWLSNIIATSGFFMQNCSFLDESWLLPVKIKHWLLYSS